ALPIFLDNAIDLPVTGKYNATNAMIAAYVALKEGVTQDKIQKAFATLELTRNRTEWKKAKNGADILSDVYCQSNRYAIDFRDIFNDSV
ncbi:UDP-N-acetylmuramoyl-tripeptide-D-alanyl-D-alanine ligase, partial [human gut metagenome]